MEGSCGKQLRALGDGFGFDSDRLLPQRTHLGQEGEIPVVVENHEVMPEGTCRDEAID
jgi:hypothetical protein